MRRIAPVTVPARNMRQCNRCHAEIAFVQNKSGKWYAINAVVGVPIRDRDGRVISAELNQFDFHRCKS